MFSTTRQDVAEAATIEELMVEEEERIEQILARRRNPEEDR